MRPRVAVVVEHAWHRVPGGTATAVDETIRALLGTGGVELIGIAAAHRAPPLVPPPIEARHSLLPRPVLYEAWHRLGWPRSGHDAEVIWAPAMAVPPPSKPLVVTVHDLDFLAHPERLSPRGASFFPRAWRAATQRAARIVVPSTVVAQQVIDRGVAADRIAVVPWGVDATPASDAALARVDRLGLPERFVFWAGTTEPRKNLPGLVEALQQPALRDVHLVVAGPQGWGPDRADVLAPLGARATVVGTLDRADLHAVYARATVFAFPSFDEGFGLPVLEAMAQGAPVVTSRDTATAEVAGDAAILIDPHDVVAMAEAIAALINDPQRRAEATLAGHARVAEATWDRTAAGYLDVFRQLVDQVEG